LIFVKLHLNTDRIAGVMVSVLALIVVDHGFKPHSC